MQSWNADTDEFGDFLVNVASVIGQSGLGELEITRRMSLIAACCSSASSRSRMTRAISVSWTASAELRRRDPSLKSADDDRRPTTLQGEVVTARCAV
jgi:hypothetical protein